MAWAGLLLAAALAALTPAAAATEAAITPAGWMHPSCVHRVPHGARVTRKEGGGFHVEHETFEGGSSHISPCNASVKLPPRAVGDPNSNVAGEPFKGGWQVYAKQQPPRDVTSFLGSWNVPDAPKTYTGQTVFLFTGMQNIDWVPPDGGGPSSKFDIIQPVLQYGPSSAGGGEYWSISSWYVPEHDGWFAEAVYSDVLKVEEGDTIFGNMTRTADQEFFISTASTKLGNSTAMKINKPLLQVQPWMYVTLESYADYNNLTCDMWPSTPATFTNLHFAAKDGTEILQDWQQVTKNPICGDSVAVDSHGGKVVIGFKNGQAVSNSVVV